MIHTSEIDSVVTTVGPVNTLNMPKPAHQRVAALSQDTTGQDMTNIIKEYKGVSSTEHSCKQAALKSTLIHLD